SVGWNTANSSWESNSASRRMARMIWLSIHKPKYFADASTGGESVVASEVWPAHTSEPRDWRQKHRGGTRDDRTLTSIDVTLPPLIAQLDFSAAPATATLSERAVAEIAYTEGSAGSQLAALGRFLTQTESVSSSKIERVEAGSEDFARALVGIK